MRPRKIKYLLQPISIIHQYFKTMTNHYVNLNLKAKQWCNLLRQQRPTSPNEETQSKVIIFQEINSTVQKSQADSSKVFQIWRTCRETNWLLIPNTLPHAKCTIFKIHELNASFNQHQHGNNLSALNAHMTTTHRNIVGYKTNIKDMNWTDKEDHMKEIHRLLIQLERKIYQEA